MLEHSIMHLNKNTIIIFNIETYAFFSYLFIRQINKIKKIITFITHRKQMKRKTST